MLDFKEFRFSCLQRFEVAMLFLYLILEPTAEIIHLSLGIAHKDGTFLVPLELRRNAVHCAEG